MFLIITHVCLYPIYKKPQIQLSTAGSPAHQLCKSQMIEADAKIKSSTCKY